MKKTINNIFFDEGLNKLFGYDKLFNNFVTLFNTKKLPKVLILTGDKGIGKFTFIFHFINFILSKHSKSSYDKENFSIQFESDIIKKIKSNVEQNFNYFSCEKPSNVSVDNIRDLKLKLSVLIKLLITFSFIALNAILLKLISKKRNKIFFIKEHLFCQHD